MKKYPWAHSWNLNCQRGMYVWRMVWSFPIITNAFSCLSLPVHRIHSPRHAFTIKTATSTFASKWNSPSRQQNNFILLRELCIFQSFFFGVPLIFISATDRPADDLLSRSDEYLFCSLYTDPSVHFFAKDSEAERYWQFVVDDERRSIVIWSVSECSQSTEDNENDKY